MSVLHGPAGLDVDQADLPVFGPLSERTFSGLPRSPSSRSSTRVTRPLPRLVSASSTRFSDHSLQRFAVPGSAPQPAASNGGSRPHRLQPLRLAHVHATELLLPSIERGRADPVIPAQLRRLQPSFALLQDPDDLLFAVPALLPLPSSRLQYERNSSFNR